MLIVLIILWWPHSLVLKSCLHTFIFQAAHPCTHPPVRDVPVRRGSGSWPHLLPLRRKHLTARTGSQTTYSTSVWSARGRDSPWWERQSLRWVVNKLMWYDEALLWLPVLLVRHLYWNLSLNVNFILCQFNRRHHCRRCGRLVCHSCSSRKMALEGSEEPVRVCDQCYNFFHME